MFVVLMAVNEATGNVRSGLKKAGKPWKMAEQEATFYLAGQDIPIVGYVDIYCPPDINGVPQDPMFFPRGLYEVPIKLVVGEHRRIAAVVDVRGALPISPKTMKPGAHKP